jgi:hypothetical protein
LYNEKSREGTYYFNARWYDPEMGRFVSEDPVRDGSNWYGYCLNNPMKFTDPWGLQSLGSWSGGPGSSSYSSFSTALGAGSAAAAAGLAGALGAVGVNNANQSISSREDAYNQNITNNQIHDTIAAITKSETTKSLARQQYYATRERTYQYYYQMITQHPRLKDALAIQQEYDDRYIGVEGKWGFCLATALMMAAVIAAEEKGKTVTDAQMDAAMDLAVKGKVDEETGETIGAIIGEDGHVNVSWQAVVNFFAEQFGVKAPTIGKLSSIEGFVEGIVEGEIKGWMAAIYQYTKEDGSTHYNLAVNDGLHPTELNVFGGWPNHPATNPDSDWSLTTITPIYSAPKGGK